ncbi:MAG: phage tail family protein [Clostridia bacterium]|nr:phage tail family protein [Clostridia bacterium]
MRPSLTINGVSSNTITGLLITDLPPISKPLQRTLIDVIDGRDGDIITPLGYSAYDKPVKIALTYNYNIDDVIKFFDSKGVVIFSNEPNKYYRFGIYEQIDFERLIRFKTAEVVFHVQPFKLAVDEQELAVDVNTNPINIKVFNAGNVYSRPIFSITGKGTVSFNLNGSQLLSISLDADNYEKIIIDSEAMNAYSVDNLLLNRRVTGDYDNIKFVGGSNTVTLTGDVSQFTIKNYSRWI